MTSNLHGHEMVADMLDVRRIMEWIDDGVFAVDFGEGALTGEPLFEYMNERCANHLAYILCRITIWCTDDDFALMRISRLVSDRMLDQTYAVGVWSNGK